jgi:type I site-specific restriction-modification system R (restriction) subunit
MMQRLEMRNPIIRRRKYSRTKKEMHKARRSGQPEKLVGAKPRVKEVAVDLVKHFKARMAWLERKAVIVAFNPVPTQNALG